VLHLYFQSPLKGALALKPMPLIAASNRTKLSTQLLQAADMYKYIQNYPNSLRAYMMQISKRHDMYHFRRFKKRAVLSYTGFMNSERSHTLLCRQSLGTGGF